MLTLFCRSFYALPPACSQGSFYCGSARTQVCCLEFTIRIAGCCVMSVWEWEVGAPTRPLVVGHFEYHPSSWRTPHQKTPICNAMVGKVFPEEILRAWNTRKRALGWVLCTMNYEMEKRKGRKEGRKEGTREGRIEFKLKDTRSRGRGPGRARASVSSESAPRRANTRGRNVVISQKSPHSYSTVFPGVQNLGNLINYQATDYPPAYPLPHCGGVQ